MDEQPQTPQLNPDLAGYPSVDGLVKGYRESSQEAQKQRLRAEAAELALQALAQNGAANPRQSVPDRSQGPEGRLSDLGIPVDELRQVVRQEAAQMFEPITRGIAARQTVLGRHKDYQSFEADVANWVQSDPERNLAYQQVFATNPVVAMEWAFQGFADDRRRAGLPEDTTRDEIAHAQIPGARNGETRRMPQNGEDRLQRLFENYQNNPNKLTAEAYARERLHRVITDDHLNA